MTTLSTLSIDLGLIKKEIDSLLSNAGNINQPKLFQAALKANLITSQLVIEADRLVPAFKDFERIEK